MKQTHDNVTVYCPEENAQEEIDTIVEAIRQHDTTTSYTVMFRPRNYSMVETGHIHVTPRDPEGQTLEQFVASITRYFTIPTTR